jgi:bacteriocin-like protein
MSKSNDDTTKTRELTEDELNHVSGGVVRYIDDALGTGVRSEVSMTFALNSHVA